MAVYDNIPVYVGEADDDIGSSVEDGVGRFIFASQYSVAHSVSVSKVNRLNRLGSNCVSDGMVPSNDDRCEIDIEFFLLNIDGNEESYSFLLDSYNGTGQSSFPIRVGANIYKKCFLDNYSVRVRPFEPVRVRAKFECIDFPENEDFNNNTNSINNNYNNLMSSNNVVYSYSSTISGVSGEILNSELITDFSYDKKYNRELVKKIGIDCNSAKSFVEDVEIEANIESTGFKSFMSRGGDRIQSDILFVPRDVDGDPISTINEDIQFLIPSGTLIVSQEHNAQGGENRIARLRLSDTLKF